MGLHQSLDPTCRVKSITSKNFSIWLTVFLHPTFRREPGPVSRVIFWHNRSRHNRSRSQVQPVTSCDLSVFLYWFTLYSTYSFKVMVLKSWTSTGCVSNISVVGLDKHITKSAKVLNIYPIFLTYSWSDHFQGVSAILFMNWSYFASVEDSLFVWSPYSNANYKLGKATHCTNSYCTLLIRVIVKFPDQTPGVLAK